MSRPTCLASCFLPLNEENCRWWLRLQDELAANGLDLVLVSTAPAADPQLRTIVVPLWLQGFAQAYGASTDLTTLEAPLADALARRERSWIGQENTDLAGFKTGVVACQETFRMLLEELQPAVVLVWGNSLAQSVVLQQLAVQQGRPCWVIERGLLPGTLMIEMAGQGGQTELNWSFNLQNAWRHSPDTNLFAVAQEICRNGRAAKYAQAEPLAPEQFHQRFNPGGKPVVALLLQHDAASCMVPADFAGAKIHSPVFDSSVDAIRQLATAARAAGCKLIVKLHPIDQTDYAKSLDDNALVLRDVNLHSLIGAADVVAAMTSTAQYEALLHEKPLLLLARSALAGKEAAYEVDSPAQLLPMLRAALKRDDFSRRQANARRFISFLLQNFSVSLSGEMPAGATLSDLAKFLTQNAVAPVPGRTIEDRLTTAGDWLLLWESCPKKPSATGTTAGPKTTTGPAKELNYKSHIGQDIWVAECLNYKRNGFFLDFGAFDGLTISNTYALEKDLGWRGICVEPNPHYYQQVCERRSCVTVNAALWPKSRESLRFINAHGLSSLESFKSNDVNADRRARAAEEIIEVDTLNPTELLERFNAPVLIDFLSLDVEGAEYDVLSALDLKKFSIALMTIEHNHDRSRQQRIREHLAQFGYEVMQNHNEDYFFHRGHLARITGRTVDPVAVLNRISSTYHVTEDRITRTQVEAPALFNGADEISTATKPQPRPAVPAGESDAASDARYHQGMELLRNHSWAEAGQVFNQLATYYPHDLTVWHSRIDCCHKQGHTVLAKLLLKEALGLHPEWRKSLGKTAPAPVTPAPAAIVSPPAPASKPAPRRRKSCTYIESGLVVLPDELRICCYWNQAGGQPLITEYKGGPFPIDKILAKRAEIRAANEDGVYAPCDGCFFLREDEWPENPPYLFTNMDVATSTKCGLRCHYCYTVTEPARVRASAYDPYLLFKQFIDNQWLSPDAQIIWSGGEPTTSQRFEEVQPLLMIGNTYHRIQSHCGWVSDAVVGALRQKRAEVICSLDAGTRETYHKVKGRDWFHRVVETCARYAAHGGNLRLKYICLAENLGRKDLDGFLAVARQLKVRSILCDYDKTYIAKPSPEALEALGYLVWQARVSGIETDFFATIMAAPPELRMPKRITQLAIQHLQKSLPAGDLICSVTPENGGQELTPLHTISVMPGKDAIILRTDGNDPQLLLPEMIIPSDHRIVLALDITAAQDDLLEVYFMDESSQGYTVANSVKVTLVAGRQQTFLSAFPFNGGLKGRIRLDPGCFTGDYLLHRLDVYALKIPSELQSVFATPGEPGTEQDLLAETAGQTA